MAFDRPIEADRVDDLGLLSSLIRAPVLGIMWLLGGEHDHSKEAKEEEQQKNEPMERELLGNSDGGGAAEAEDGDGRVGSSNCDQDREKTVINSDDSPGGRSSTSSKPINQAEINDIDKENKENESSSLKNSPSVEFLDSSDASKSKSKQMPRSSRPSSRRDDHSNGIDPANEMIDALVAVMESSHIGNRTSGGSPGPATSAVLTSQSKMTASSSTNSLTASYSASTFSNHEKSQPLAPHSSITNGAHPSQTCNQNKNSNSTIRGEKKMSWSDECGKRSLVEYSDEPVVPPQSKHWSAMRRSSYRASRHSFDGGEKGTGTRRSEVKVIRSALKRSGSYSPPVALYVNNVRGSSTSTSCSTEFSSNTSSQGAKSFKSLSAIGSTDSSRSNSSDHLSEESAHSLDTDNSMDAVTSKKLNSNDVSCVPSTLQVGCGLASGGLIIPRGGPACPTYYFPRGGGNDPSYQLILGTGVPSACGQQADTSEEEEKGEKGGDAANARSAGSPNPTAITGGRSSPGHHHFLPRHTNGYISPQYGFYVNITPPTPEVYAKDKSSRHAAMQQQSYQQFYQNKHRAPSPIPEGYPGVPKGIPHRYVGRSSVPRPSSNRSSAERDQMSSARQNSLKPTFTKNKKGMGMILADNSHHGVWPTVPFG